MPEVRFRLSLEERINAFASLGEKLRQLPEEEFEALASRVANENPWFTPGNVRLALEAVTGWLNHEQLAAWASAYPASKESKTIALVMAGNIPLAGFHDFLCVIISCNRALIKLSSKDTVLFRFLLDLLLKASPSLVNNVVLSGSVIKGFDGAIATGSDNSSRYFKYYFGRYPCIIRKNRSSVAVLTGQESPAELTALGLDVFSYFGLGCRNVSKIFAPGGFSFDTLMEAWAPWSIVLQHHKYANNYDYQKSILLVNRTPHLDNGFLLLREEPDAIVSPIATIYYSMYNNESSLLDALMRDKDKIQCIVGKDYIPFGKAQYPELTDYADNVDTMKFLSEL